MNNAEERAVDGFPDPTAVGDGEFARSGDTRARILEAAINLLAERGYAATSTSAVARAAGLSRTAMLYHFPSRQALLEALVAYVTRRRVAMLEALHEDLPRDADYRSRSVDLHWEQLQTAEFHAFCELATAARTDRELAAVFRPALAAYDRARRGMALKLAEPSVALSPVFDLRRDLQRFLMEGIVQQDGITYDQPERLQQLLAVMKWIWSDEAETTLARAVGARAGRDRPNELKR